MATRSTAIEMIIDDEYVAGTFLSPEHRVPGVLFVHGWGGSQERDLARARGIAGLGCVCLTFDLRGHQKASARQKTVSRAENMRDLLTAYDRLVRHPAIDSSNVAVVGTSYGGYLASILTVERPVKWLSLRVPSLYRDAGWERPKRDLSRDDLALYRRTTIAPEQNRALAACAAFQGDVLLVESEFDHLVPHATLMSYRNAFRQSHSMTHRIIDGADHSLSSSAAQHAYTSILQSWFTEMVIGARTGTGAAPYYERKGHSH